MRVTLPTLDQHQKRNNKQLCVSMCVSVCACACARTRVCYPSRLSTTNKAKLPSRISALGRVGGEINRNTFPIHRQVSIIASIIV